MSDGRYAVWDMRIPAEVRFFGAAGDYLGAFGRPGEGPGEFGPVWVALWVPRPDWPARLERWQRVLDADYYANHALHRTRLEAFDPETGEFLGPTEVDAAWVGFVGDGQAYSYETNEIGIPFVNLWRVRLH